MSEKILLIETSTECCSAAICDGPTLLAERVTRTPRMHASILAPFIDGLLHETGLESSGFKAVAVSKGPGSYTGLRVGVSTAKGFCFGSGRPLIGVDTLEILAMQAGKGYDLVVPMIDARRMEVYAARFDADGVKTSPTEAVILDQQSYLEDLDKGKVLFIGDGVAKFREICHHPNAFFQEESPLAAGMVLPALRALRKKEFEDTAYFEPFYLKEFVAGISKKSVL